MGWAVVFDDALSSAMLASPCDSITVDLEDGVPLAKKCQARPLAVKLLTERDFHGKERLVRVNDYHSPYFADDLREVIAIALPDGIRLPKCECVKDVLDVDAQLGAIEKAAGLAPNSIEIVAMIESALGIRNAYEIAVCCPRVTALNIGMEDLHRDMQITRRYTDNELDLLYARQKLVLDAKAAKVQAIDSSLLIQEDVLANSRQSRLAALMGFTGRSISTPLQAEEANQVFSPSASDIAEAQAVADTYERTIESSPETPKLNGKSICYAAYERALDILSYAAEIQRHEARLGTTPPTC